MPQQAGQLQANDLWPRLTVPQQAACIDSVGELCASLRRGIVPLLHTGTPEPSSSGMAVGRKQRRASASHACDGHSPVLLPEGPHSSMGGDASRAAQPRKAGSPSDAEPKLGGSATSAAAVQAQRCDATSLQALEASSGAGASAETAVLAPRSSSCSDEAAAVEPTRSPGDRTDSDDEEGVRRRGGSPTEARRSVPGNAPAARETDSTAAGPEAERQPEDGPSDLDVIRGGTCGAIDASGFEARSPQQVCITRERLGAL